MLAPLLGVSGRRMGWLRSFIALAALLAGAASSSSSSNLGGPDGVYDMTVTRLAFGSCSKQYKNQTLWEPIMAFDPQAYLWLGDVIYLLTESDTALRKAYAQQLQQPGYKKLLESKIVIDGVFDDHDYGVNDGHRTHYTEERQNAYLNFLDVPESSPRWKRQGLYSSHVFGAPPRQVKVIFLDTRSLSDMPALVLPFDGLHAPWPLKPLLLAVTRWVSVMLGMTKKYDGDLLGEEQWRWLEAQLKDSDAAIHLIVSSIQVLSTNPIVEGWGHYPQAQQRFVSLLRRHNPRGLLLLSGDVHFAELLTTQAVDQKVPEEPLELTTSGMTHTCFDTAMGMCAMAVRRYNTHRFAEDTVYGGFNFGTLEVDWGEEGSMDGAHFVATVRDSEGASRLVTRRMIAPTERNVVIGEPYSLGRRDDLPLFGGLGVGALGVVGGLAWFFLRSTRQPKTKKL